MLTTQEIQELLDEVTYKPGWSFSAYDGHWEGSHLVIQVVTPDAFDPNHDITLDIHTCLPPIPSAGYLDVWLTWRLLRIESHEVREWYRRKGEVVFNPHTDEGNHDVLPAAYRSLT